MCYENATWAEPDVSDCQSRQFQGLKETVRYCSHAVEIYIHHIYDKHIKMGHGFSKDVSLSFAKNVFKLEICVHAPLQAEELFSKGSVNISVVLDLVDVLTEATAPDTNMRSLFPSDLNTTNLILTGAIDSLIDDFNQTGTADPEQVYVNYSWNDLTFGIVKNTKR